MQKKVKPKTRHSWIRNPAEQVIPTKKPYNRKKNKAKFSKNNISNLTKDPDESLEE